MQEALSLQENGAGDGDLDLGDDGNSQAPLEVSAWKLNTVCSSLLSWACAQHMSSPCVSHMLSYQLIYLLVCRRDLRI